MSLDFKLLNDLSEARLVRSSASVVRYTAKDIADIAFLHLLAIQILKNEPEFETFAAKYAKRTIIYNNFNKFRFSATDTYQLFYILVEQDDSIVKHLKKQKDSREFLDRIELEENLLKKYFRETSRNKSTQVFDRRFFLYIERALKVDDANYKAMRRLVSVWDRLARHQKKLVTTRLLLAFRIRAQFSDIRPAIEKFAKVEKLEMKNVCNPEIEDCDAPRKKGKWLKRAGIVGAVAGAGALGAVIGAGRDAQGWGQGNFASSREE